MAENYTRLADTISSHEGKAYITINGQNRELFEISALTAQIDLIVQEKRMLGHRMTQHKVVGATGTGSMTIYFMNSEMLNQAIQYLKTGNYKGLKLQVKNEDPQSTVGKQEVVLLNVILASLPAAILDDSSDDPITFDTDFTFDDIEILESFKLPENYR
jgi:hypothetical protein